MPSFDFGAKTDYGKVKSVAEGEGGGNKSGMERKWHRTIRENDFRRFVKNIVFRYFARGF